MSAVICPFFTVKVASMMRKNGELDSTWMGYSPSATREPSIGNMPYCPTFCERICFWISAILSCTDNSSSPSA